jgi:hypothetical protein
VQDRQVTLIRPAGRSDVTALVRLRLANAERHVQLAPDLFRIPDEEAVRRYFKNAIGNALISVAEVDGEVVGMVEVVLLADPPDHQILVPRRAADVHTVVLDGHRVVASARLWSRRRNVLPQLMTCRSSTRTSSPPTTTPSGSTRRPGSGRAASC